MKKNIVDSKDITEDFLKQKYGPIYSLLFKTPTKSKNKLHERNKQIVRYLIKNPGKVFQTENIHTIYKFDSAFEKYKNKLHYGKETIQDYERKKKLWKVKKGGILSKPVLANIFKNITFGQFVDLYNSSKAMKKQIDKSGIWDMYLIALNDRDNRDYKEILGIDNTAKTVLVVLGVEVLLPALVAFYYGSQFPIGPPVKHIYTKNICR